MRRPILLVPLVASVLALAACSSSTPDSAAADPAPVASSSPTEQLATPLEGTWTTHLTRDAAIAYIHKQGWDKEAEKALLEITMPKTEDTVFRTDFIGNHFRMALAATDEQWQSGTFRIEDGRIYLDDEAPVGELTFRLRIDGDQATYDKPVDTSGDGEIAPGVPIWAPGGVMWASTTWERTDA